MRSTTLASVAAAGLLAFTAAPALGAHSIADHAVVDTVGFRLNTDALEPGAYAVSELAGAGVSAHVVGTELHVTVDPSAPFSVDQVLVPGAAGGYRVYNAFHTGSSLTDPAIDPDETAMDLLPPAKADLPTSGLADQVIVVVSNHDPATQNEPYEQAANGEVAAVNRPIITPMVSALGVSAIEPLNTYKVGFGYGIDQWYDNTWRAIYGGGDPQAFDFNGDALLDHVFVIARAEQAGVRRFNDIDEFGEQFGVGSENTSYGQPFVFDAQGDQFAYLHKSLPGAFGAGSLFDALRELGADQTSALGLVTFTTQGDLPISWSVKGSLAPERYARTATLTDQMLRAWEQAWQDYYVGKGPKPTMPLAPGTNSPAPKPGVIVNQPQQAVTVQQPGGTTATVQQPMAVASQAVTVGKSSRIAKIRLNQRIVRKGHVTYMSTSGLRMAKAYKSAGRLVAKVDLRGITPKGGKWSVLVSGRDKHSHVVQYVVQLKL